MGQNEVIYAYTPPVERKPAVIVVIICGIIAAAGYFASYTTFIPPIIGQLIAVVSGIAAIQITTRFLLTHYTYILEHGNEKVINLEDEFNQDPMAYLDIKNSDIILRFVKTKGKEVKSEGGFPVNCITESIKIDHDTKKSRQNVNKTEKTKVFNFTNNLFPAEKLRLNLVMGDKKISVLIEADEYLTKFLKAGD